MHRIIVEVLDAAWSGTMPPSRQGTPDRRFAARAPPPRLGCGLRRSPPLLLVSANSPARHGALRPRPPPRSAAGTRAPVSGSTMAMRKPESTAELTAIWLSARSRGGERRPIAGHLASGSGNRQASPSPPVTSKSLRPGHTRDTSMRSEPVRGERIRETLDGRRIHRFGAVQGQCPTRQVEVGHAFWKRPAGAKVIGEVRRAADRGTVLLYRPQP